MDILLWSSVLMGSLFVLVKSADFFTEAAEKIGLYFGLSSFIVGATIVAVGSSMPEIATSLIAILSGEEKYLSFPVDNILGSNIANCLLVGGISAIAVSTLKVKKRLIDVDLPFFFLASALFLLFIWDGFYTWKEGLLSMGLLILFIWYTISDDSEEPLFPSSKPKNLGIKTFAYLLGGVIGIYFSAKYTIDSVFKIADIMNINSAIITMIAVAIGTSLPELIVSVKAAMKGNHSVALGNVFGSNTFNVLAVAGIPSFFGTLEVSQGALTVGIPFFIVATLGFIFTTSDNKIRSWEGAALLVVYIAFCGKLVGIF